MSLLNVIGGVFDFVVGAAKFVWNLFFGRGSNPSDDIIFNPLSIWLILGFWIFILCYMINLMMKASDPFASREQPKPLAGMDLDVLKLMQAKKNEDKQPPKKDPNFQVDRVK